MQKRPPLVPTAYRLTPDTKEKIRQLAIDSGVSQPILIGTIVNFYLENHTTKAA